MARILLIMLSLLLACVANGKELTEQEAVTKAEIFIVKNGYTKASSSKVSLLPEPESMESSFSRPFLQSRRFNTLQEKAIGARKGRKGGSPGWSVAFDYVDNGFAKNCRVVTMSVSGDDMRIEHVDGIREYFVGFGK